MVLYETAQTRVTRIWPPGGTASVVRKEPLGPHAVRRARHEARILRRLSSVAGVIPLAGGWGDDELVFADVGGAPLAALMDDGRPDIASALTLALALTRIVAAVHRAGVLHKDINPMNVLVTPAREPLLIDFGIAGTFGQEHPGFVHQRQIDGTLPYLAPEQTGRTGMWVDERADLYGLGATMYELLTGRPVFAQADPLRMVHDALTSVPVAPTELDGRVPQDLSELVMRLLEKDPDRRYQSADGVAYDLSRLTEDHRSGTGHRLMLGARDFPSRLSAPSRLIGREAEIETLRSAYHRALAGAAQGVLVAGGPGVGKSALVNGLRSLVTSSGGWFVSGKFDQYRQDSDHDGVRDALRGLGRLLLACAPEEVEATRMRIRDALGANLVLAGAIPEFAVLLDVAPVEDPVRAVEGDAATIATRLRQTAVGILQAVASADVPVVLVLDDLQWAGPSAVGFVDAVLMDGGLTGVLLVGTYRSCDVGPTHPLATTVARWERLGVAWELLALENLEPDDLSRMLADMLRLPSPGAAALAASLGARTAGNPYDTLELVNALRREGVLTLGVGGWSWDESAIRGFVGHADVLDLLAARIADLPAAARTIVELLACLGGDVGFGLLHAAAGLDPQTVGEQLLAPLEDGLLLLTAGDPPTVRFRHDRVHQAAYARLDQATRGTRHLAIARRLCHTPTWASFAAGHYLSALEILEEPGERREAARLLVDSATAVRVLNPAGAERSLEAAIELLATGDAPIGDPLLEAAKRQHHLVLYARGRLDAADAVYAWIAAQADDPLELVESTCVQVASLTIRGRPLAAVSLGLELLGRLGIAVPEGELTSELRTSYEELGHWASGLVLADDLVRPTVTERVTLMAATLIDRLLPASFFCDPEIAAWLTLASQRAWVQHGPCGPLAANLSCATLSTIRLREDYRTGYKIAKHALAVAEARGYEPATACARHRFSMMASHWIAPLEDGVHQSQIAREGLVRAGDLQMACFTYFTSVAALLDCAPTLDSCAVDVESALTFATRTGNDHAAGVFVSYRQLVHALRGETTVPGGFNDDAFDEATHLAGAGASPMAAANFHVYRALSALVFGDEPGLVEHAQKAIALLPGIVSFYPATLAHLLQGVALAHVARTAPPDERRTALVGLDDHAQWLDARAADAPANFGHLATLVHPERAWAAGDPWEAAHAFDRAMREVASARRTWHQALITERAARFHLANGLEKLGRDLLREAAGHYASWCATAKVAQLEAEHGYLRAPAHRSTELGAGRTARRSSGLSSDEIDMTAILRASQTLSAQTSLAGLQERLGEILSAMTGATAVRIGLRSPPADDWLWRDATAQTGGLPTTEATQLVPVSAIRYAQRTREPLVVEDACRDDRFAGDPYLTGLHACSLLVVPILSQGGITALVVLENTHRKGAFSSDRLDAVNLITGQLAVSLNNAQLYDSLERTVAQRTAALEEANRTLEALSNTDALTQIYNRRHFDATLSAEVARAERQGTALSLAMVDIDRFKLYNDRYGHPAGDACLRAVAVAVARGVRVAIDTVCRYGGEEFAVILPGADEAGALVVGERIRSAVTALHIAHDGTDRGTVSVSVSIGVATMPSGRSTTTQQLMASSDRALYRAKQNGRDQVRHG